MTPEDLKIMLTIVALITIIGLAGFVVVFFFLRYDNRRITWIENEFYRRENEKRTKGLTGEVRSMQKDGYQD